MAVMITRPSPKSAQAVVRLAKVLTSLARDRRLGGEWLQRRIRELDVLKPRDLNIGRRPRQARGRHAYRPY